MHMLWLLLLAAPLAAQAGQRSCQQLAADHPPEEEWINMTSTPHSRPLPDKRDRLLGFGNWAEDAEGNPQPVSYQAFLNKSEACHRIQVARFKLYDGVLYADQDTWKYSHLPFTVEQLLAAKYLYKDIPDRMDIVVAGSDLPGACDMEVPMLLYTIVHPYSLANEEPIFAQPGRFVFSDFGAYPGKESPHSRGYSIPYKDAWMNMAMSPGQMKHYMDCVQERHGKGVPALCRDRVDGDKGAWAAARKPQLVWRGSTTGRYRGWAQGVVPNSPSQNSTYSLWQALWNKRYYAAAMSRPYPHLDVGIKALFQLHPQPIEPSHADVILNAVHKPHIGLEEQSSYQLALSIDGNAGPWRYGQQMLGLTPIVRVDTPFREFFHHWLVPGVHYELAKADLSDFVSLTKSLIDEMAVDSRRLECMALQASQVVLEHMHAVAQLDSFVWSLMKVQAAYQWQVKAPEEEKELIQWRVWPQGNAWIAPGLRHIRDQVKAAFPKNYGSLTATSH